MAFWFTMRWNNWRESPSFPVENQTALKTMKEASQVGVGAVLAEMLPGGHTARQRTLALEEHLEMFFFPQLSIRGALWRKCGSLTWVKGFIVCSKYKMVIVDIMVVS